MSIDVGRLLGDIIDDTARLGGGVIEIGNAILDDPRLAVLAIPEPSMTVNGGVVWVYDPDRPAVQVRGAVMQVRAERFNTAAGDDPTAFVASQIAAYRRALKAVPE